MEKHAVQNLVGVGAQYRIVRPTVSDNGVANVGVRVPRGVVRRATVQDRRDKLTGWRPVHHLLDLRCGAGGTLGGNLDVPEGASGRVDVYVRGRQHGSDRDDVVDSVVVAGAQPPRYSSLMPI